LDLAVEPLVLREIVPNYRWTAPVYFAKSRYLPTFFVRLFFRKFFGVSPKGEFKNTMAIFWVKIPCRKFFAKKSTKIQCQSPLVSVFFLITFLGVTQREEQKKCHKKYFTKVHVEMC
jgi:hypothetical protein